MPEELARTELSPDDAVIGKSYIVKRTVHAKQVNDNGTNVWLTNYKMLAVNEKVTAVEEFENLGSVGGYNLLYSRIVFTLESDPSIRVVLTTSCRLQEIE